MCFWVYCVAVQGVVKGKRVAANGAAVIAAIEAAVAAPTAAIMEAADESKLVRLICLWVKLRDLFVDPVVSGLEMKSPVANTLAEMSAKCRCLSDAQVLCCYTTNLIGQLNPARHRGNDLELSGEVGYVEVGVRKESIKSVKNKLEVVDIWIAMEI
ncbi:hypothetical protein F0562_003452 [Nyssa sinensis]|uniref:Uncharacterized protein n=1 Tax=Nyssa sinensis TaxID=561372 RepID=A0A5J5BV72_9ASTE|nr:hypothetical protein F0562_003452 [Nyssa sinensis]